MKKMHMIILVMILMVGCAQKTDIPATQVSEQVPTQLPTEADKPLPSNTIAPTETEILLTETPKPSATPEPTTTPEPPTQTLLPEGTLFRDDFEGVLQPGWEWINEDPENWRFVEDGWLEITGGNFAFYSEGDDGMSNFLSREVPDGDFAITAHIQANPTESFQQATIYIFENQDNYIALNIGFCGVCRTGGPGFYMETFIDHNPFGNGYVIDRSPEDTDVYLRLVNQGGSVTGYYATKPGEWQKAGAFGNYFDFNYVGLGTTNSNLDGVEHDIVSRFDYFEITIP